ncbi:MAG TPA: GNAT family N-acetyltransferase, partial [Burkholderiales bacterium]|nr:GNAT family N-acetyltransferase [Burkholderiales bacterium]
MPTIALLSWEQARAHASPVRFSVFVEEQGVPREIEIDEQDSSSVHAVVFDGEAPVATGRLLP